MMLSVGRSRGYTLKQGLFSALLCSLSFAFVLGYGTGARAENLADLILELTQKNNLIKAAEDDLAAARERAKVTLGEWYPELSIDAAYGAERQNKPSVADTALVTRDADIKITQLLWDFGKTNADIRQSALVVDQSQASLDTVH